METLAGYTSSDDSDSDKSSSPTTAPAPPVPRIIAYSEEYSENMNRLTSAFAYMPWQVTAATEGQLRQITEVALEALRANITNFGTRYQYNSNLGLRAVLHGLFGHTNKNAINVLHVSLFPNLQLPKHQIEQFEKRVTRAMAEIRPPSVLVAGKASKGILDLMLEARPERQVSLHLQQGLQLYMLNKTDKLFVGLRFRRRWKGKPLPEYEYLGQVTQAIQQQVDALGGRYSWLQFVENGGGAKALKYHLTLLVCELKGSQKMSTEEFLAAREAFAALEEKQPLRLRMDTSVLRIATNHLRNDIPLLR